MPLTADTAVVEREEYGLSPDDAGGDRPARRRRHGAGDRRRRDPVRAPDPQHRQGSSRAPRRTGRPRSRTSSSRPSVSLPAKVDLAHAYADRAAGDHYVGVTGPGPARLAQFEEIENALPFVELGTVLAIALVVGLTFRSLGAPLLTLLASGISFLVASGLIP